MRTITERYTGPSVKATRKGHCPICDKPVTRTRTFTATVNPFNRRPDGAPKTWEEVAADVAAKADAWSPEPAVFEHDACRDARATEEAR